MNKLIKTLQDNYKVAGLSVLLATFVFLILPFIFNKIDPSSKILDLSLLNVVLVGIPIIALTWGSVWATINTVFSRTLDAFADLDDLRQRFQALPDEKKFDYLFKTVWVLSIVGVIAFKPIIFVLQS